MSEAVDVKRERKSHIWAREERSIQARATEIGSAGEHIVCADILLSGLTAFQASQGLPYDVIIDVGHSLLRVAVKSTMKASRRPARESMRLCYQFAVTRSRRLASGKTDTRKYNEADIDLVAFVALDIRAVAYCHITECAQSMHFDVIGAPPPKNMRGCVLGRPRKTFESYSLARALAVHHGDVAPLPFKWRSSQ